MALPCQHLGGVPFVEKTDTSEPISPRRSEHASRPYLHFNVVLNGRPVDPFAMEREEALWLGGNSPVPHNGPPDTDFTPTNWNEELLDAAINECGDHDRREHLESVPNIERRAAELIGDRISYKTLFTSFPPICEREFPRAPLLDLPFCNEDFVSAVFP